MPNRGGFSWKRLTGISAAKARVSRRTGIPLTRSGRHRKIGRALTGGGCLVPLALLVLVLATIACGSTGTVTPGIPKATAIDGKALAATLAVITPDPTDEPAFSDDERTYIEKVLDIIGPIPTTMQKVSELSLAAGDNTSLILDNDWRTTMGLQLGIIKGSAQLVQDLKAPAKFAGVQAELVTMAKAMDEGATLYAQGIDEVNPKKITQASAKFEAATASMKQVGQMVVELQQGKAASSPASALSVTSGPTAAKGANLRSGPGTTFAVVDGVKAGDPLQIVGTNAAGDWYKLAGGQWIAAFLVTGAPKDVPVVDAPSSSAPAQTSVPAASRSGVVAVPMVKEPPTAGASSCSCDSNTLNCSDFPSNGWDAQSCYLRCKELAGRDVHDLDRDHDGDACEWSY